MVSGASVALPHPVGSPSTHPHFTSPLEFPAPRIITKLNDVSAMRTQLVSHFLKLLLAPSLLCSPSSSTYTHAIAAGYTTLSALNKPISITKAFDNCFRLVGVLFVNRFDLKMPTPSQMPQGTGTVGRSPGMAPHTQRMMLTRPCSSRNRAKLLNSITHREPISWPRKLSTTNSWRECKPQALKSPLVRLRVRRSCSPFMEFQYLTPLRRLPNDEPAEQFHQLQ